MACEQEARMSIENGTSTGICPPSYPTSSMVTQPEEVKPAVKEETDSTLISGVPASATSGPTCAAGGSVTEDEIRVFLTQKTIVTEEDLFKNYEPRLQSKEEKDAFAATLRRISNILEVKSDRCPYTILKAAQDRNREVCMHIKNGTSTRFQPAPYMSFTPQPEVVSPVKEGKTIDVRRKPPHSSIA